MDKELKEMLNDLKEMLEIVENTDIGKAKKKFEKMLNEALEQPCKITIEKGKNGEAKMGVEGNRLSLLIALAGAEKGILKQVHCSDEEFDFIKNLVGTKDADDDTEVL